MGLLVTDKLAQQVDMLPEVLRPLGLKAIERLADIEIPDELSVSAPRALACSDYLAETLARYPDIAVALFESGRLLRPLAEGELAKLAEDEIPADCDDVVIKSALRRFRHKELCRIAWRDVAGMAALQETLSELSALADTCICAAIRWSEQSLFERFGVPVTPDGEQSRFVVLGMGKLGGGELNFSSDIDLVFLYSDKAETNGKKCVTAEEYFRSLSQRLIQALDNKTVDGFVYRVDVRLRPFGTSGPLAVSESAFEEYLMSHGRDWERYAYVKARVVNEWGAKDEFYENVLRPFCYRRYLDYGVFSSLREMKAMIEAEGRSKRYEKHVKLGPGGIREVEFIVQTLQLVRGGTIRQLRERRLLVALEELANHELLPPEVAEELRDAYCYLRLVENHIQAIADRQTHELPDDETDRARVVLSMGLESWDELMEQLNYHRSKVSEHFNSTLRRRDEDEDVPVEATGVAGIWLSAADSEVAFELLDESGFKEPAKVAESLKQLRSNSAIQRLDEIGRARLDRLVPQMIMAAIAEPRPDAALAGGLQVLEAIGRRSAYFSLLNENPEALKRLLSLAARSSFLIKQITVHPLLLDELLDQRIFMQAPQRADLEADISGRLESIPPDDPEAQLDAIRNFQQAAVFRVAVADLSEAMPLMKVSDRLTDIAELVVESALGIAMSEMVSKHGTPMCKDDDGELREAHFGVLGYGKMGGWELGYGSDLDLVFIHDSAGDAQMTDGKRSLDNSVFFGRLAQRLISMLTMRTLSGELYEVDTRLRPNGASGHMVSSLQAFEKYQKNEAWTWEHQSLLRSRAVAGPDVIKNKFAALREKALTEFIHFDELKDDVLTMRKRMRKELDKSTDTEFHVKHGVGGVVDIEFLVQYLVLNNARNHHELIIWSDNVRQLEALAAAGILNEEQAESLADVYRDYRGWLHRLALGGHSPLMPMDEAEQGAGLVQPLWAHHLG